MGIELVLSHQPDQPATKPLTLISKRDYGAEVQAPSSILRFALPRPRLWQHVTGKGFARFKAGDLIAIQPDGNNAPRLYSLASCRKDGFVEIVVKKHAGGLCSGQLHALKPGDNIHGFLQRNSGFHLTPGSAPLILIGAGTGIGPLAGFIRGNNRHRPTHLYFGMRHPDSDFLYDLELPDWQRDGRLTQLTTAHSRTKDSNYVQDALLRDRDNLIELIRNGAHIMVCGGRGMAAGVADKLSEILMPLGLSPANLKAEGRYVEDVY